MRILAVFIGVLVFSGSTSIHAKEVALSVTWLVPGQPPQTTVTDVSDIAACEKAKANAIAAGDEARATQERLNNQNKSEALAQMKKSYDAAKARGEVISDYSPEVKRKMLGEPIPTMSAFCIEK